MTQQQIDEIYNSIYHEAMVAGKSDQEARAIAEREAKRFARLT